MVDNETVEKIVEKVEVMADVGAKVANFVSTPFQDTDHSSGLEENTWMNYLSSFGIHIAMIIIVILLKWQYDRNRYRYPKGPRDWRNIKDAIGFHRKKRENLLVLATDYPESCTVMTHVGRLVLLNDISMIKEIFISRADMCSNKVDNYLENQLRYKPGKHIRTGIVFRHQDHNAQIIHKALVTSIEDQLIGTKRIDAIVQRELDILKLTDNFDVRRTTFGFALRLIAKLCSVEAAQSMDEKTFELFNQNLYKISKVIHEDTLAKSAATAIAQATGLSETLDINKNVLDYIQTWVKQRRTSRGEEGNAHVTTTTKEGDLLDAIVSIVGESSPTLDEEDIAAILLDLLMHGSEMLKAALSWLLLYVVQHPEEAQVCRQEVKAQSYTSFNLADAKKLVYTEAFVKEVLRLSPVVPVVIHTTLQDFKWRDYHIMKRTQFGANIYALHYAVQWKESTKFDVERWLGDNKLTIPTQLYSPFGFGPRACVFEDHLFALLTGLLGVLLYNNDFEKTGKVPDPTEGTFGLANLPPKFSLKATPLSGRPANTTD